VFLVIEARKRTCSLSLLTPAAVRDRLCFGG
jgi:hypothetical protein